MAGSAKQAERPALWGSVMGSREGQSLRDFPSELARRI